MDLIKVPLGGFNAMKKRAAALIILLIFSFTLVSCGKKQEETPVVRNPLYQLNPPSPGDTIVTITTSRGTISAVLYSKLVPDTVNNFIKLADSGYYDGMLIHKVIKDFVIQMGDPTLAGNGGESFTGEGLPVEYNEMLHNFTGALGMAAGPDGLSYSQFYIVAGAPVSEEYVAAMKDAGFAANVIAAYEELGGLPSLDYEYTVFGQVYEGLELVQEISGVKADKYNRPKKDIVVSSVSVTSYTVPES